MTEGLSGARASRDGSFFDPNADVWSFRDAVQTVRVDFARLNATSELKASARGVLATYAESSAAGLAQNFHRLRAFFAQAALPVNEIDAALLLNHRSSFSKEHQHYFGVLASLLRKWLALGYPGIAEDARLLLKNIRVPGAKKGVAVLTLDSQVGPLTDVELEAVTQALDDAYESADVSEADYLLSMLIILLGQRPAQYAALKASDLQRIKLADGSFTYLLSVPRAKRRGQPMRSTFTKRLLTPKFGQQLYSYCERIMSQPAPRYSPQDAPMFPTHLNRAKEPPGFEGHRTASSVSESFSNVLDGLQVQSERTGKPINIIPYRFRRTIGTRAAVEGHGELVIAELLDHSDTQHAGIYTQAVPEIIERIDRALAMSLAPLAQAFAGLLIDDESQAKRGSDPASRICSPSIDPDMKPMGSCGKFGFCGLMAPLACYTCRSFQPWRDGPHEQVLKYLLAERERLVNQADVRIASINDRTLLAVAQVVTLCSKALGGTDNG